MHDHLLTPKPSMPLNSPDPSPQSMRQSCIVFGVFLLLAVLAISFPEVPEQGLYGVLWLGIGILMLFFPPMVRIPRIWTILAAGFVLLSLVGFLPRSWFGVSEWRLEVEKLGVSTGNSAFVQPQVAVEFALKFAITAMIGLYVLGHRIHSRCQQWIALSFSLAIVVWIILGLVMRKEGQNFGFFPNRNHTAALLSMAVFVSVGALAQAIRHRKIAFVMAFVPGIVLPLWILLTVSISRSGIVLVGLGLVLWFVLDGRTSLRGNTGKALFLLAIAAIGAFFLIDSTAKNRLTETAENWKASASKEVVATQEGGITTDTRWLIFKDTWNMICSESWPGVGAGQFAYVYPQYRNHSNISTTSIYIHPESDWLMMAAEVGLPATGSLLAAVACVLYYALRNIRTGKGRLLRVGCLIAAILLLSHGIFDVPSHRIGMAMLGILFLSCSIQGINLEQAKSWNEATPLSKNFWRICGSSVIIAGAVLVICQASGKMIFLTSRNEHNAAKTKELFLKDEEAFKLASARGLEYDPPAHECPIEEAILLFGKSMEIVPLDRYNNYNRGRYALYLDDKEELARKDFAIQRLLDPNDAAVCIDQANCWGLSEQAQVYALWKRALELAEKADLIQENRNENSVKIFQRIIYAASLRPTVEGIYKQVLDLAASNQKLRLTWIRDVPSKYADQEIPKLLLAIESEQDRKELFEAWKIRGNKEATSAFAAEHPEFGLSQP